MFLAKALVPDLSGFTVSFDGQETSFFATSLGSTWLIRVTYGHSTHILTIRLDSAQMIRAPLDLSAPFVALVSLILIAVAILLAHRKRHHTRTLPDTS